MHRLINFFLFIILFYTAGMHHAFSKELRYDESKVLVKVPSKDKIENFKKQSDFDYTKDVIPTESLFQKILRYISRLLDNLFSDDPYATAFRYIVITALIIFIIFWILKIKPKSLFFKNKGQNSIDFKEDEFYNSEIDLDKFIEQAISDKNYRLAIRYLYLKLLNTFSENDIIELHINKTNSDYLHEIQKADLKNSFRSLSLVYDFVWYGEFSINKEHFENVHSEFNNVYLEING